LNLGLLDAKPASDASRGSARQGFQDLLRSQSANDEQARAIQEFKNPVTNDSSSDEEDETAKKKKIKFVINPKGTAVDVNKVKEATQQLKLGPAGLSRPIERTRSATQDLLGISGPLPPPGPVGLIPSVIPGNTQIPTQMNPALNPGLMQVAPPVGGASTPVAPPQMVMGMGVTTGGPIPEDFFQHTTSAIATYASFESGSTNLAPGGAGERPVPVREVRSQGSGTSVHLMDGPQTIPNPFGLGVPPQAMPPQVVPPRVSGQPIRAIADPFAGGVPPASQEVTQFTPPAPAPSYLAPAAAVSSDLGSLVIPNNATNPTSGVPDARPTSPPIVARPGQVNLVFWSIAC
jgi:hypothetical protein